MKTIEKKLRENLPRVNLKAKNLFEKGLVFPAVEGISKCYENIAKMDMQEYLKFPLFFLFELGKIHLANIGRPEFVKTINRGILELAAESNASEEKGEHERAILFCYAALYFSIPQDLWQATEYAQNLARLLKAHPENRLAARLCANMELPFPNAEFGLENKEQAEMLIRYTDAIYELGQIANIGFLMLKAKNTYYLLLDRFPEDERSGKWKERSKEPEREEITNSEIEHEERKEIQRLYEMIFEKTGKNIHPIDAWHDVLQGDKILAENPGSALSYYVKALNYIGSLKELSPRINAPAEEIYSEIMKRLLYLTNIANSTVSMGKLTTKEKGKLIGAWVEIRQQVFSRICSRLGLPEVKLDEEDYISNFIDPFFGFIGKYALKARQASGAEERWWSVAYFEMAGWMATVDGRENIRIGGLMLLANAIEKINEEGGREHHLDLNLISELAALSEYLQSSLTQ